MSIINSVLGSLSPPRKLRTSFEDPHAREHELPLHDSPSSPRIPPPVTATVLWTAPKPALSPQPRVPDDLLALQRRARHLEKQLQELLDAQADGLVGGLSGQDPKTNTDDLVSNGSTTPTASSIRSTDRGTAKGDKELPPRKKKIGLNAARLGISKRIRQLAHVKAEELDLLDEDLRNLQVVVEKTDAWTQKRARLENKIKDIESESDGARTQTLQTEASKLELDIRQKEQELWTLKARHRQVLNELADTENSVEAKLSSYKTSQSILNKEVSSFLARPPDAHHLPMSSSPFLTIPVRRRTLEMAREYWHDEYNRLADKCEVVDTDRGALDDGVLVWDDVVRRISEYESSLQDYMQNMRGPQSKNHLPILEQLEATIDYLEQKMDLASSQSWNLLMCAIGAELEAFKQGKDMLQDALGVSRKGKEKAAESIPDHDGFAPAAQEMTGSTIRIARSPPKPPPMKQHYFDTDDDNEDPDPELLLSHHDTD